MPSGDVDRRDAEAAGSATQQRDPKRYRMLGEHGRGGLGRVSRAHDIELGRDVAIKELISRGNVSEVRFLREALITARLEHPGIVPVHEAGRWPDGTPFYAMKLVAGRSLRELIFERNTIEERIGLLHHVIAVADAIAYAHGRNIIHRDLKPANVIVGDFGETVVIDWGLAKDLSDSDETLVGGGPFRAQHDDGLTSTGTVLGTPAYMAPEQQRGESVDQRADVYAIGAMLWELCVVEKLPPGATDKRRELLRASSIDPDLLAIVDKAIDPVPERRYPDAGALAADLKAFKAGARIAARRYSPWAMLAHWTRRHRALAAAIAIAALISTVGSALYVRNIAAERDRADASDSAERASLSELTLRHAELLLGTDPTAALDVLATYRGDDVDRSRQIRAEAIGQGVASLRATPHNTAIRWVQGTSDGTITSLARDGTIARTTPDGHSHVIVDDALQDGAYAYSASRHLLAYACEPEDLCLLEIATGRRTHLRPADSYAPRALSFSTNELQLAVLSRTGALWLLDVNSMPPVEHARLHPGAMGGLLLINGNTIALGDRDGLTMLHADGTTQKLPDRDGSLWDRGPSDDQLVIATRKGELYLVGTDDMKITMRAQVCRDPIGGLRTLRSSGVIAYACEEGTVGIWDPQHGQITLKAHLDGHPTALVAADSGEFLLAVGPKGVVMHIDLARGTTMSLRGHAAETSAIAPPTAEYPMTLTADTRGALRAWPVPPRFARLLTETHQLDTVSALYDASESTVVGVTPGPTLLTYSSANGLHNDVRHTLYTPFVAVAADGQSFATYGSSAVVEHWGLSPLTRNATLNTEHDTVTHVEFVPGSHDLVTAGHDGRLVRWAGGTPHELHRFGRPIDMFAVGAYATVVATSDGALWRVDGDDAVPLRPPGSRIVQLRALPDGAMVAGAADGAIEILEPLTGRRAVASHASEAIRDIAVARNGDAIAIAAGDGTIRVAHRGASWFTAAWNTLLVQARRLTFTRDGLVIAIGDDGAVWIYAPAERHWVFIPTTTADLSELVLDDRSATAFVFDVGGRLMAIDIERARKSIEIIE